MSWMNKISDLANNAESLLNSLDQNTGAMLNKNTTPKRNVSQPRQASDQFTASSYLTQVPAQQNYASSVSSWQGVTSSRITPTKTPSNIDNDERFIAFLNQDTVSVTSRSRKSSTSSRMSNKRDRAEPVAIEVDATKSAPLTTNLSHRHERDIIELRAREQDMQKTISAKDSQLAVLRVRLQESEHSINEKNNQLTTLKSKLEQISTMSDDQSTNQLNLKIEELNALLAKEQQKKNSLKTDYLGKIDRLQDENAELRESKSQVENQLQDEKRKNKESNEQLRLAKYNLEQNKHEFDEYKQKAQRILQVKEKMIETLRTEQGGASQHEYQGDNKQLAVQLEEACNERDMLKDDLESVNMQLYNAKMELQDLDTQFINEQRSTQERLNELEGKAQKYHREASTYREQLEQLKLEYQYTQEELRQQQITFQNKFHEKDEEINRLMAIGQNSQHTNTTSPLELENRIKQLTESIIHKQTIIEGLQTDKNALSLQIERLERQFNEAEHLASRTNFDEPSSYHRTTTPSYLRETPYDTQVARHVKRAYTNVDTLSVKLGLFLRRYPIARLFVIFYMILLHGWVALVLLTYTPEMHAADYQPLPHSPQNGNTQS